MSTVAPPNPALVQLLTQAANAPPVQIVQPPPAITALPAGTVVEAVVLPPPPAPAPTPNAPNAPPPPVTPNITLQTGAGIITARTPVQLPEGTRVELEVVRTANNQVSARLITVNDVSIQGVRPLPVQNTASNAQNPALNAQTPALSAQNAALKALTLPIGQAWSPSGPVQMTALGPISAFVILGSPAQNSALAAQPGLAGAQTGQPATPGAAGLPQGAPPTAPQTTPAFQFLTGGDLTVRITSLQVPGAQPPQSAPGPLGLPIAQPTLTVPGQMGAAPGIQPQPGLVLPGPGGLPPAAPTPPQTVQPSPILSTVTGTVASLSAAGAPIVQIDTPQLQGQIQLNARANVPVGTLVTLEVTAQAPPQTGATTAPPNPVSAMPLSGPAGAMTGWPTLTESLTLLQRTDPAAALQLAQSIPDGGPRTAVAVIAFAQALRTGDPRQWPGDTNLRAIERAGPRGAHLAAQLSGEVSELAARTRDVGSEWRSIPVPWNAEGRIERIALVTRREESQDEEDEDKQKGGKGTRFLINLDLSRLGALQLDGMFRKETRGFDMMIRTKETLPDYMRRDLTGMFASSNAAMGLKGGLSFQVVKKFPDPIGSENPAAQDKSGLWV